MQLHQHVGAAFIGFAFVRQKCGARRSIRNLCAQAFEQTNRLFGRGQGFGEVAARLPQPGAPQLRQRQRTFIANRRSQFCRARRGGFGVVRTRQQSVKSAQVVQDFRFAELKAEAATGRQALLVITPSLLPLSQLEPRAPHLLKNLFFINYDVRGLRLRQRGFEITQGQTRFVALDRRRPQHNEYVVLVNALPIVYAINRSVSQQLTTEVFDLLPVARVTINARLLKLT